MIAYIINDIKISSDDFDEGNSNEENSKEEIILECIQFLYF